METRLGPVDTRLGSLDTRLDAADTTLDSADNTLGSVDTPRRRGQHARLGGHQAPWRPSRLDGPPPRPGRIRTSFGRLENGRGRHQRSTPSAGR
jgi:hypothetical protein